MFACRRFLNNISVPSNNVRFRLQTHAHSLSPPLLLPRNINIMASFTGAHKEKYDMLCGMGLPAEQAAMSVQTDIDGVTPSAIPTHTYAMLKINDDGDMEELRKHLAAYSAASKASAGKISAAYTISQGEVLFVEIWSGPGAMNNHIGNCFPHYAQMLPHCTMTELVCITGQEEVDFWKKSASA